MKTRIVAICILSLLADAALADATIVMLESHAATGGQKSQSKMYVRDGKVVMRQEGQDQSVLFDSASGTVTQVDHGRQEYWIIDEATMDEAQSQVAAMMKQMEAQMAGMSEEQKKMIMQQLPKGMPGLQKKEPDRYEFNRLGKADKVAGFKCEMVEMRKNGALDSTACVASPRTLGLSDDDFETMSSMIATMQSFADRFAQGGGIPSLDEAGGFPIRSVAANGSTESQLVSIDLDSVDDEIFAIPASYSQRKLMQR